MRRVAETRRLIPADSGARPRWSSPRAVGVRRPTGSRWALTRSRPRPCSPSRQGSGVGVGGRSPPLSATSILRAPKPPSADLTSVNVSRKSLPDTRPWVTAFAASSPTTSSAPSRHSPPLAHPQSVEDPPEPPEEADGLIDLTRAVGRQVKLLRERAGLTQKELGGGRCAVRIRWYERPLVPGGGEQPVVPDAHAQRPRLSPRLSPSAHAHHQGVWGPFASCGHVAPD